MIADQDSPVLVEIWRGDAVESQHRGIAVAVDVEGRVVFAAGDAQRVVYPRSALKFFQSIPLLESGAADFFNLTAAEIALACASHGAEDLHLRALHGWLARLNLGVDDLECGADMPLIQSVAHDLIRSGDEPTRAHQNCSGKHAAMLTLARFMEADLPGYSDYHHPVQRAWMTTLSELIEADVRAMPWERDGCGMPAVRMPLQQLAAAFARYADGKLAQPGARGAAMARILAALRAHPRMLAGAEQCGTDVILATQGRVLVKAGAEGVYGGVIPHLGMGFALKVDDGAGRAQSAALGGMLAKLGALDNAAKTRLARHFEPRIVNSQGYDTGRIAAARWWTAG